MRTWGDFNRQYWYIFPLPGKAKADGPGWGNGPWGVDFNAPGFAGWGVRISTS